MKRQSKDRWAVVLGALGLAVLLLVVVGSIWLYFAGPCWVYKFEKGANIPGRCLMHDDGR